MPALKPPSVPCHALFWIRWIAPICAPRPNRVPCGPRSTSTRCRSKGCTTEPRDLEIDTPSWNTDTRGSTLASPLSEVMPRITKPGLFGLCSCTSSPGTRLPMSVKSLMPNLRMNSPEYALIAIGTSDTCCSRFCAVTTMVSSCCAAASFGASPRAASASAARAGAWAKAARTMPACKARASGCRARRMRRFPLMDASPERWTGRIAGA